MSGKKVLARVLLYGTLFLVAFLVLVSQNPIRQSKPVRARADIASVESALTKMLRDSGSESLAELFASGAIHAAAGGASGAALSKAQFQMAISIDKHALYALLRDGRHALNSTEIVPGTSITLQQVFEPSRVRLLGSSYIDMGFDPWGNLYNIFPGPWPEANRPIPLRIYHQKDGAPDTLTVSGDCLGDATDAQGFPAPLDKIAYIWSNGENLRSDQATYSTAPGETPHATGACAHYDPENGGPEYFGGGDDVNNWDVGSSWSAFY